MSKIDESSLEIPGLIRKMREPIRAALIAYDEGCEGDVLFELSEIRRLADIIEEEVKPLLDGPVDPDDWTP